MSRTEHVTGADEAARALRSVSDQLQRGRVLRNALAVGARLVRNASQAAAPVLAKATKRRTPGLLRKSIKVRTSKRDRADGNVGVFVDVKPAGRGQRGAASPLDPYYWQWVEFGRSAGQTKRRVRTRKQLVRRVRTVRVGPMAAVGFLQAGARQLPAALQVITPAIARGVAKLNRRSSP